MKSEEPPGNLSTVDTGDFLASTDRNYFAKLWDKLSARKAPAERVSLHKQHETARKALVGKIPPDYTLVFHRGPVPAPAPAPIISGLHCFTYLGELQKDFEFYDYHILTPTGPYSEKSGKVARGTSKYPGLTPSCLWSKELSLQPPEGNISPRPGSGKSESEGDEALKELQKQSFAHEKASLQNKKHSISVVSRPGSNTKPILPPIPQGRK